MYGLYNIVSDSKYTGDVYGVDKAFLGKKGVIALVEDTMCNICVLDTNTYEIESVFLCIRKESASTGWYTMYNIYFRIGIKWWIMNS